MFEAVKAIHAALRTESTWAFVLFIAVVSAVIGGSVAWLVDRAYKNSLPPPTPAFRLRHEGLFVFPDFPQPLLYRYGTPPSVFLAPIGLAFHIEVINNRPTKTKVTQYFADIQTSEGKWFRVLNLSMSSPHEVYFLNGRDIRRGFRCTFEPPTFFDSIAVSKVLDAGEPLRGWMFFEWPRELREARNVSIQKVKLTIKNAHDETAQETFDLTSKSAGEQGASMLGGGGFGRGADAEEVDLSSVPIRPVRN